MMLFIRYGDYLEKRPSCLTWPVHCLQKKTTNFWSPKKLSGIIFIDYISFLWWVFESFSSLQSFFEWLNAPARLMTYLKEYLLFWSPSPIGVNYSSPSLTYHLFTSRFVDTHAWQAYFLTLTTPFFPLFFLLVLLLFCPLPLLVPRWSASRSH